MRQNESDCWGSASLIGEAERVSFVGWLDPKRDWRVCLVKQSKSDLWVGLVG